MVFNEVIAAAEAGDTRVFGSTPKVAVRISPRQSGAFTSTYECTMYGSNTSFATIIRNEELVLMYAEANVQLGGALNVTNAIAAINSIRNTYGLPNYGGAVTTAALINEILNQRRYSLFFEGHRWFDMRRYGKLAQILPQGAIGGNSFVVFDAMSRPDAEVQWDNANP